MDFEKHRQALAELIDWNNGLKNDKRNEATTRFHLIDSLLLEVLGWQKADILAEDSLDGEYTDYTISLVRPSVILEAKKEGIYFELPSGKKGIEYSIDGLRKDNPLFKKAINQVCAYCNKRGVEVAIVSNGWQIVAFIANRLDGVPPLKGNAIVFDSLEKMLDNFLEFWNYLSRDGIESKKLKNKLCGITLPELPPKLSASISYYPGIKNRNPFQTNLQILSELILEDVLKYSDLEEVFLKECYCNAGALSNYAAVSKEILKTRYENLFEEHSKGIDIQSASNKAGINQDFKNVASQSLGRRPILLVGDVGAGKSTFIDYLTKIEAPDVFKECITFKIDLGNRIILSLDIRQAIVEEIIKQLLDIYNIDIFEHDLVHGIYNSEFSRFKKGIYKLYFEENPQKASELTIDFFEKKITNKHEHLRASLLHLAKGRKKQIVIFIDNCDQRDYDTQQTAFLIAQEIADSWQPVTVFISLRPETFHNSIKLGALSGYHPKAFTISPPRVDLVIEKRLEFAKKIANGDIPLAQFEGKIGINLSTLKELISVLIFSFENNLDLHRFIENICNGNIRIAIDIVKNFLGSGHVDTEKIIKIYNEQGHYTIPLHEFVRAVIFGNNVHYSYNNSYVVNLFDVNYNDSKEHFILLFILTILESKMNSGKDNGFLETDKVMNFLQSHGYSIDQIDTAISVASKKNLIESSAKGLVIDKDKLPLSLRLTQLGSYHLIYLVRQFTYIDAIIVDTPIFDPKTRLEIQDVFEINERIYRAEAFIKYLDESWNKFDNKPTQFDWSRISNSVLNDINRVKSKLSRNF